jgi:GGDEF domain-containing protein
MLKPGLTAADVTYVKEKDGIVSILRREPERSAMLLKVGLAGPLLVVAWNLVGSLFLSPLIIMPFSLLLILSYAGVFGYLMARLVRSADRWEVDSAMHARRLLNGNRRGDYQAPEPEGLPLAAMAALASPDGRPLKPQASQADFHRVYFMLRLEEEVHQARREGRAMTVLAIDVSVPHQDELTAAAREKLAFDLATIASGQSNVIGHSLSIGATEFVFSLPHCDENEAKAFVKKLLTGLGNYWCHFGLAVYPREGTNAELLFDSARERCDDSRNDLSNGRNRLAIA